MPVAFIPYKDLDKQKYDTCICTAANRMVYARSFYLDNMAVHWDALVLNDYEAVMPLPWKKKFNVKYLYQPAFVQQGGIFSQQQITDDIISEFIEKIKVHFNFAEITLNYANCPSVQTDKVDWSLRTNYIINLGSNYELLFKNYDPAFLKSLRRLNKFKIEYVTTINYCSSIQLYSDLYKNRLPYFNEKDFTNFENVCRILSEEGKVITRLAYAPDKTLLAALLILQDGNRLYNMISCITPAGKKMEANYFLYDKLIEEFADQNFILDLEGSDIKGIADFYKKLNPLEQPYPFLRFNNLHPILKLFKN